MRIEEMTFTISRKYNLGNYESIDFFVAIKVSPDQNEDITEFTKKTREQLVLELLAVKNHYKEITGVKTL